MIMAIQQYVDSPANKKITILEIAYNICFLVAFSL